MAVQSLNHLLPDTLKPHRLNTSQLSLGSLGAGPTPALCCLSYLEIKLRLFLPSSSQRSSARSYQSTVLALNSINIIQKSISANTEENAVALAPPASAPHCRPLGGIRSYSIHSE